MTKVKVSNKKNENEEEFINRGEVLPELPIEDNSSLDSEPADDTEASYEKDISSYENNENADENQQDYAVEKKIEESAELKNHDFTEKESLPLTTLEPAPYDSKSPANKLTKFWQQHRLATILGCTAGLIVSLSAIFYATNTNLMKLNIANVPVGRNIAVQPLQQKLQASVEQYKLTLKKPDNTTESFQLSETGVFVDVPATVSNAQNLRHRTPFLERLAFWKTQRANLSLKVDDAGLAAFIKNHLEVVNKSPKNAKLSIEKGIAIISPEADGDGFTVRDTKNTLLHGIGTLQSSPYIVESSALKPAIATENLVEPKKKVEKILEQTVTINVGEKTVEATPAEIGEWIELTPIKKDKTVDVTVNSGKVLAYITAVAKKQINPPKAEIVSTQSDGSLVVLAKGQNGMNISDKEAAATDITKKIMVPSGVETTLTVKYEPFKTINAKSYDKWLAIDVSSKRMYAYEKTKLMKTYLISAGAPGTPTVLGQYKIQTKVAKQDMRGLNTDGSRYFQSDVQWVNYFFEDYAIHGNHWRPLSYFGNINSSHGCVGIVNSDAKWIYNWAPVGTPIIVFD